MFAFSGCTSLLSFECPASLREIKTFAFKDCTSLSSIYLPESVKSLGFGVFYGCRVLPENFEKAWKGNADAQFDLAKRYLYGYGVAEDIKKSIYWLRAVSEKGNPQAQKMLADCYSSGKGVGKSFQKAAYWYSKAAEQGFSDAQFLLSLCYYEGAGVPKNPMKVKFWLEKAAEQDNVEALKFIEKHPELNLSGASHISYHAGGDIIQGNQGFIAKDDAIVNRASFGETDDEEGGGFCPHCGISVRVGDCFCKKCGGKLK